jgi:hypothetical protein
MMNDEEKKGKAEAGKSARREKQKRKTRNCGKINL